MVDGKRIKENKGKSENNVSNLKLRIIHLFPFGNVANFIILCSSKQEYF